MHFEHVVWEKNVDMFPQLLFTPSLQNMNLLWRRKGLLQLFTFHLEVNPSKRRKRKSTFTWLPTKFHQMLFVKYFIPTIVSYSRNRPEFHGCSNLKMNSKNPRKKVPVKTIYHHVIRAKLYAILTMNALEGMMLEMNNLITAEMNRSKEKSMLFHPRQLWHFYGEPSTISARLSLSYESWRFPWPCSEESCQGAWSPCERGVGECSSCQGRCCVGLWMKSLGR